MLDLFVNNEKTLLAIYDVLFPQPSLKYTQLKGASDMINLEDPNKTRISQLSDPNQLSIMLSMQTTLHEPSPQQTVDNLLRYQSTQKHSNVSHNLGLNTSDLNTDADSSGIRGNLSPY